jgi:hypothetical protein
VRLDPNVLGIQIRVTESRFVKPRQELPQSKRQLAAASRTLAVAEEGAQVLKAGQLANQKKTSTAISFTGGDKLRTSYPDR